jgi:hypothetical protein
MGLMLSNVARENERQGFKKNKEDWEFFVDLDESVLYEGNAFQDARRSER